MNVISSIWEGLKNLCKRVVNFIRKVVQGILNFFTHIVSWFKKLRLKKDKEIPFLMDGKKLKELIKKAPIKEVGIFEKDEGIFKGVYNEDTGTITHHEIVEADELDEETRKVMGNEELVVLS